LKAHAYGEAEYHQMKIDRSLIGIRKGASVVDVVDVKAAKLIELGRMIRWHDD
jgi:hypothetical protein